MPNDDLAIATAKQVDDLRTQVANLLAVTAHLANQIADLTKRLEHALEVNNLWDGR